MQCECKDKSRHEEDMVIMGMELPTQSPEIERYPTTTASSFKTEDIVIKDCKIEQSTSKIGSSTAQTLSTNAIRECNNESVIVFEN